MLWESDCIVICRQKECYCIPKALKLECKSNIFIIRCYSVWYKNNTKISPNSSKNKIKKVGKNNEFYLVEWFKMPTFALAIKQKGSVAQLNRASDYGSEGCRFESCRSHKKRGYQSITSFFIPLYSRCRILLPHLHSLHF